MQILYIITKAVPYHTDQVKIVVSVSDDWVQIDAVRLIGKTTPKGNLLFQLLKSKNVSPQPIYDPTFKKKKCILVYQFICLGSFRVISF